MRGREKIIRKERVRKEKGEEETREKKRETIKRKKRKELPFVLPQVSSLELILPHCLQ